MRKQKVAVSVIGGHDADKEVEQLAHNIGKIIAKVGLVTVCGGLQGVMQAVAKGAREGGGLTIGLLPGLNKMDANPYIDIALPTSIGYARNAIVAASADIIVALPGSHGTNSEICYGLVFDRPVIDMGGWNISGMIPVNDLAKFEEALKKCVQDVHAG